ncbi:hypothetical protein [Sinorhizobium fredii]|uniref:hypothetical protein n=1 Tax=Rhizobium fredii TaxID=380 RepID=UPI0035187EAA
MTDTKKLIVDLEANRHAGDELMARVIAELREHNDLVDELCDLDRYRAMTRTASASFIVEAMAALKEQKPELHECLFRTAPAPTWQQ